MYHSVHVMQDDLDTLNGKTPQMPIPSGSSVESGEASNPFLNSGSPFGGGGDDMTPPGTAPVIPQTPSQSFVPSQDRTFDKRYFVYGGAAVAAVLLIGIGAYFFFVKGKSQEPKNPTVDTGQAMNPKPDNMPSQIPVDTSSYYSVVNPNYLPIDVESAAGTPEGIQKALTEASKKVNGMTTSDPIEFVITDKNNNPLAFSRFAHLLGLTLPPEMVSLVDERFTVFMTKEADSARFGVAFNLSENGKMAEAVTSNEAKLPTFLKPLLYFYGVDVPSDVSFRSGKYGTLDTRFAVVDGGKGISMDYGFLPKKLIIGTSKESFQGMLGKLLQGVSK
jgi:hypothetical protein